MAKVVLVEAVVDAEESDLRVWWIRNPPSDPEYRLVANVDEALRVMGWLADEDLNDPRTTTNAGGLEVYEGGEWHEWYDEHGDSIDDL